METRLIIAYTLIALMVALAIFGVIKLWQKKSRAQRRDSGNGVHMRYGTDSDTDSSSNP